MTLLEASVLDWRAIIAAAALLFTMTAAFATFIIKTNVKLAEINKDIAEIRANNGQHKLDIAKEIGIIHASNERYLNSISKQIGDYLKDNKEEHKELAGEIKGLNTNINELKIALASKRRSSAQ